MRIKKQSTELDMGMHEISKMIEEGIRAEGYKVFVDSVQLEISSDEDLGYYSPTFFQLMRHPTLMPPPMERRSQLRVFVDEVPIDLYDQDSDELAGLRKRIAETACEKLRAKASAKTTRNNADKFVQIQVAPKDVGITDKIWERLGRQDRLRGLADDIADVGISPVSCRNPAAYSAAKTEFVCFAKQSAIVPVPKKPRKPRKSKK